MSIDKLQNQIRKLKNPSMVSFALHPSYVPKAYLETVSDILSAYGIYAKALLTALKGIVPAVRFSFASFSLHGAKGMEVLRELLATASQQGFYVLLDTPELLSAEAAEQAAEILFENGEAWPFNGLLLTFYIGSDALKPFVSKIKDRDQDLFLTIRTANRSASELQDLLTGSRLVYTAAADMAKRLGESVPGRFGYSRIAGMGPATSADVLRTLRGKYSELFLLVDGYEFSGANAKNCSFAFDQLGHGAIVCAGSTITAAWKNETDVDSDPIIMAQQAAERMKKNLSRYVTVL